MPQHTIQLVHYLPIATTALSLAFITMLLARASKRRWPPHLMWWAVGIAFYGIGTAIESTITLTGNTPLLNRLWYWAGAILGGYPLATGSVYLLLPRRRANQLTIISGVFVVVASVLVFVGPMKLDLLQAHRPIGRGIWQWRWLPWLTPFINLYALVFLVGGALASSVKFALSGTNGSRAAGTGLIALGGMGPAIGGAMTKAGNVEALYIGELIGLILICAGYLTCVRAPAPQPPVGQSDRTPDPAPNTAE